MHGVARSSHWRHRMFRPIVCAGIIVALTGPALDAQIARRDAMSRLARGLPMRAVLREGSQPLLRGKVDTTFGDTVLVLVHPDSVARLALDDLATLEVYRRSPGAQVLAQLFFGVGAVGGAALYIHWCARNPSACRKMDEDPDPYDDEEPTPMIVSFTLTTGLLMGALGFALAPPHWEPVDLPIRVSVAPSRSGVLLYASVTTSILSR
jgi:hypothetical protein